MNHVCPLKNRKRIKCSAVLHLPAVDYNHVIIMSYHIVSYCTFLRRQFRNTGAAAINQQVSVQQFANVPGDSVGSRMPAGKLFQKSRPAMANDVSHSASFVRGTSSVKVPADRMPGRRVKAGPQYSAKYAGARPVRHLCKFVDNPLPNRQPVQ